MRPRFPGMGLFVTLLALTCQIAIGAAAPAASITLAQPSGPFGIICHHNDAGGGAPAVPIHTPICPGRSCQFCPLCAAFTMAAPTLLAVTRGPVFTAADLAFATLTPVSVVRQAARLLSASPRGPPVSG